MHCIKVKTFLRSACSGTEDAVLSRRDVLAGLGCAGAVVVAGSTLLVASSAEAKRTDLPVRETEPAPADAARAEAAEDNVAEHKLADLDTAEFDEFSARHRRWHRRRWRRFRWRRRRRRWVCRTRRFRRRIVRVCRRVW